MLSAINVMEIAAYSPLPQYSGITFDSEDFQQLEGEFYALAYEIAVNTTQQYHDAETIIDGLSTFYHSLRKRGLTDKESPEYLYFDARINAEISMMLLIHKSARARGYFYKAFASAQRAVSFGRDYSNFYALYAFLQNQIVIFEGLITSLLYLTTISQLNEQALILDRRNPLAWQATGLFYLYTPRGYGGNPNQAILSFKRVITLGNNYWRWWGQLWLAYSYFREGSRTQALSTINHLRLEAPHSFFLFHFAEAIQNNRDPLLEP